MATYLFYLKDDIVHDFDPKELTGDCACLVGGRWGGRTSVLTLPSGSYVFFATTGFAPSLNTCLKAIGELSVYFGVVRGSPDSTAETLVKYLECRKKWSVPEDLSLESSGSSGEGVSFKQNTTLPPGKRWKTS